MAEPDPREPAVDPLRGLAPPRGARHVIAVAGSRGGVGASVTCVNLAVYLAQLGRRVALVDADPTGAQLHTHLGVSVDRAPHPEEDDEDGLELVAAPVPGLRLAPQRYSRGATSPVRPGRRPRWARGIRQLDVDYVVLDLGAGTAAATLDLFLSADLGLLVTSPEPPSIEGTYRFACALFQRRLRRALVRDRFKGRMADRAQAELPPLPSPLDVLRALARYDSALAQLAARELAEIRPRLLVNDVRLRTDAEVGPGMVDLAHRYLGVTFDPVGSVEHDDAVWLSVVRRRPLLVDSPASKGGRNFERVARRVVALLASRDVARPEPSTPVARPEPNLYDVLLVHRSATDEELRRAYKRQRELFQSGSLPLTSLLSEDALRAEQARIEEAHDTLLDPLRRRAYDLSTFPDPEPEVEPRTAEQSAAHRAELELLRAEIARELSAETEFTGDLLRRVREAQGTEIDEIARRTKISAAHLRAIEAEEFSRLPAIVYARGFLTEVAKCLGLDPTQVTRTYLRRLRERSRASDGAGS